MRTQFDKNGLPTVGEGRWTNHHHPTEQSEFYRQRVAARVRGEDPGYSPIVFGKCEMTHAGLLQAGDLALARELDAALNASKSAKTC